MGRRSRKRQLAARAAPGAKGASRAERDAAPIERARRRKPTEASKRASRPRRTTVDDRPPPLWGAFPLTELVTLAGIVLMAWGFLSGPGSNGNSKIIAGLLVSSIAGLELSVREHVTGFRSHTTLISGAVGTFVVLVLAFGVGLETFGLLVLAGTAAFAASFVALRELFKRRSGGLSFR